MCHNAEMDLCGTENRCANRLYLITDFNFVNANLSVLGRCKSFSCKAIIRECKDRKRKVECLCNYLTSLFVFDCISDCLDLLCVSSKQCNLTDNMSDLLDIAHLLQEYTRDDSAGNTEAWEKIIPCSYLLRYLSSIPNFLSNS